MNLDKFKIDAICNNKGCYKKVLKKDDVVVFEYDFIGNVFSDFFSEYDKIQPILRISNYTTSDDRFYYDLRCESFINISTIQDLVVLLNEIKPYFTNTNYYKYIKIKLNGKYYVFDDENNLISEIGYDNVHTNYLCDDLVELTVDNEYFYYNKKNKKFVDLSLEECIKIEINNSKVINYKNKLVIIKDSEVVAIYDYVYIQYLSNGIKLILAQNINQNLKVYDYYTLKEYDTKISLSKDELEIFEASYLEFKNNIYLLGFDLSEICYHFDKNFNFILKTIEKDKKFNSYNIEGNLLEEFSNYTNVNKLISDYMEYLNMMNNIKLLQ